MEVTSKRRKSEVFGHLTVHSPAPFHPEDLAKSGHLKELKAAVHAKKVDPKSWLDSSSGRNLLHYAAAANQVAVIQFLVNECWMNLNTQDKDGNTPLHHAVIAGHVEAVNILLSCRANDTICNANKDPPLHVAIKQKSGEGNKLVLEFTKHENAALLVRGQHGYSSLHVIADTDNMQALERIYEKLKEEDKSIKKLYLLLKDSNELTAFHIAARAGHAEILGFLLSKATTEHANLSSSTVQSLLSHDGRTPFDYAIERGHSTCAKTMLKFGADPTCTAGLHPPPLHMACSHGQLDILEIMVESCGLDILKARDAEGGTALHSSTSSICSKKLIAYLVEKGIGINEVDVNGFSALSNAIQLGNIYAVEELLRLGADPQVVDKSGCNSLHSAVQSRRTEVFRRLVEDCSKAVVRAMSSAADSKGDHPIHAALKLGLSDMVAVLLDVGRPEGRHWKDAQGSNYMHLAAASGDEVTLTHLLRSPCSQNMLNEVNHTGCTPLHFAALSGNSHTIATQLLNRGAVIHKNKDGRTPFMCACSTGNLETAKLLYASNKFQRDWEDMCGSTALHMAVDGESADIITFCLDKGMMITLNDCQLSFLDKILEHGYRKLAAAALSHKRWEECINVTSPGKPHPILRILDHIPEVYGILLDQCFSHCSLDPTHCDYWQELNFKCLDLKHVQVPKQKSVPEESQDTSKGQDVEMIGLEEFDSVHTQLHTEADTRPKMHSRRSGKRKEHSLVVVQKLIDTNQEAYLMHPVVKTYIFLKWSGYSLVFQTALIALHFLLALFFSVFISLVGPPEQMPNASLPMTSNSSNQTGEIDSLSTSSRAILIITLLLSILNLLIFFLQVYLNGPSLVLDVLNSSAQVWMNFIASFCILTFLSSVIVNGLQDALWNAAAIGIFFAWFSYGTSLQILNTLNIGVYITMLFSTTKLIVKVLIILLSFLFAFVLSFYILVGSIPSLQYDSPGLSLYSTLHSLIAVTDYLSFASLQQNDEFRFTILTFMLLVALIILLPIVAINVLIGLAVGDIASIQKDATLSHLRVEVNTLISFHLPYHFRKHTPRIVHRMYPNRRGFVNKWVSKIFHKSIEAGEEKGSEVNKEWKIIHKELEEFRRVSEGHLEKLQEGMEQLTRERLVQAEEIKRLEAMIEKIVHAQSN